MARSEGALAGNFIMPRGGWYRLGNHFDGDGFID